MRIDQIPEGATVTLRFHCNRQLDKTPYDETFIFDGITGSGDDRRATFAYLDGRAKPWEAYRDNGGWVYGSSAERLSLVAVSARVGTRLTVPAPVPSGTLPTGDLYVVGAAPVAEVTA